MLQGAGSENKKKKKKKSAARCGTCNVTGLTEEAGAHGFWVFAYAAQRLDSEGGALELADLEVAG